MLAASVDMATMANFDNADYKLIVLNLVQNTINTLTYPIAFLSRQLLGSRWPRFACQCSNSIKNPPRVFWGDTSKILFYGPLEYDPKFCHEL